MTTKKDDDPLVKFVYERAIKKKPVSLSKRLMGKELDELNEDERRRLVEELAPDYAESIRDTKEDR
jgi:hypothetical protein